MNLEIVVTTDKNYVMPCGVMLLSLCENNKNNDITIHIICDESVSDEDKEKLTLTIAPYTNKRIVFYPIDGSLFDNYPSLSNAYLSKAAYYRLFLTEILPDNVGKVLYLDCDLLVLESLSELWNVDIKDKAIAAVIDAVVTYEVITYNRLRYNPSKLYFNSGVMVINLDYWRKHGAIKQFMDYLSNHPERIVLHDQDILNVVFQDKKLLLPLKFNLQEDFFLKKQKFYIWEYSKDFYHAISNPVIMHYTVIKPWHKICKHPKKELFMDYANLSVWKGFELQDYPIKKTTKQKILIFLNQCLCLIHLKEKPEYPYLSDKELQMFNSCSI